MRKSFLRNLNNNLYLHFNVAPIIIIFTDSARDLNRLTFSPTGNVVDAQLYVSENTCRSTCNTNLFVKTIFFKFTGFKSTIIYLTLSARGPTLNIRFRRL